ncbi:DUF4170 domain-containing protein [Taklimakanibacter lacteus]|uniref:DUF4170 domain-containing protein n=1 Tax=Taklimakanibacter lacteus TaxID=2268456 RepID=UPI000E668EAE
MSKSPKKQPEQLLHLVFGGELTDLDGITFKDVAGLDIVGIYPNFKTAQKAWSGKARETLDNAQMRYFIVHLHRLLDPATDTTKKKK